MASQTGTKRACACASTGPSAHTSTGSTNLVSVQLTPDTIEKLAALLDEAKSSAKRARTSGSGSSVKQGHSNVVLDLSQFRDMQVPQAMSLKEICRILRKNLGAPSIGDGSAENSPLFQAALEAWNQRSAGQRYTDLVEVILACKLHRVPNAFIRDEHACPWFLPLLHAALSLEIEADLCVPLTPSDPEFAANKGWFHINFDFGDNATRCYDCVERATAAFDKSFFLTRFEHFEALPLVVALFEAYGDFMFTRYIEFPDVRYMARSAYLLLPGGMARALFCRNTLENLATLSVLAVAVDMAFNPVNGKQVTFQFAEPLLSHQLSSSYTVWELLLRFGCSGRFYKKYCLRFTCPIDIHSFMKKNREKLMVSTGEIDCLAMMVAPLWPKSTDQLYKLIEALYSPEEYGTDVAIVENEFSFM